MCNLKAYLIDDDYATNFFNDIMLKKSGLFESWKIFDSGNAALASLIETKDTPDVILLDVNMPLMSGWDFVDKYEEVDIEKKCNCIIMLSTSLNRFDSEKITFRPRIKAYQAKPLSPTILDELYQLIVQHSN